MEDPKTDHSLIEYILAESNERNPSAFSDPHYARTACEVIRFMEEMPGGFLIYHADGNEEIIYANKALLLIFQCETLNEFRELTGNSFRGIVYHEDLDEVELSIKEQVAASQYDLDYVEYRIVRKDGQIRWVEDYGHFIHLDSAGDIFYVFITDATEKREQIRRREQKLQNLIDEYDKERKMINQEHMRRLEVIEGLSVNYETILYVDLDTDKILPYRLSSRTESRFDKNSPSHGFLWFTSDYISTWVHPDDRDMVLRSTSPDYIRKQLSKNRTYYINYRTLRDGETQYLQLRIVNVGSREPLSQVVMGYRRIDEEVLRDMEQRKILEDALKKSNLAIIAKNTFLSNMSHDMRTPLNAIFGFTALAKSHAGESEAVRGYLDKVESSGKQLLDLIDKVLEISWIEANDAQLNEAECNILDILQDIYKTLLPQAAEKELAFSIHAEGVKHCDVYTDSDKLKQLVLYLANNAVKYTKNGGRVDIHVAELEMLPNHTVSYQFVVEDTGIGISQGFLSHVFEPFEREKNTTFSNIHGTGLGLTIAKNIAEMLGGDIAVSSVIDKGSIFTVNLNFRIQSSPLSPEESADNILNRLMAKKLLLVEDNAINQELESEILRGIGFQIEIAENGSIALEKLKNSAPGEYALVLMDIQMPVMDGRQATEAIRRLEDPHLSHIPIIALSADAFESDKRQSIEIGMDAHLTKPIDVPLLLDTMVKTLQRHKDLYGE